MDHTFETCSFFMAFCKVACLMTSVCPFQGLKTDFIKCPPPYCFANPKKTAPNHAPNLICFILANI